MDSALLLCVLAVADYRELWDFMSSLLEGSKSINVSIVGSEACADETFAKISIEISALNFKLIFT